MTPERWQQVEAAFNKATSLSPDDLPTYLNQLAPDLRTEVESLLEAESAPITLAGDILPTIHDLQLSDPRNNQRLGPYRILEEIGAGGMGTVFKAVRDDDAYQKTVAIKIIRANLAQTQLEQRFRAERQILAQLEHPYVAHLIDGGSHNGLPYLVMEFVEGQPIDKYVREFKPTVRELIVLFRKVCDAVQHAHNRLIVHRDLKPGNILVQSGATPKLLDFGIAKLLDQQESLTQTGWFLMTPDYASPEQVRGEAISVSSDVYSLGVILYELLTGHRPYTLKNYSPTEIQQAVLSGEIAKPNVSNDLDRILLKALHLESSRRYSTVENFSDDLRRYLDGEPVTARPDTFFYRTTKFIQRNRLAVALTTTLLLTTLIGAALVYREGLRAQRRFTQVRSIANRVLTEFDAEASRLTGNTKLRSMMVRASMEYLDSLAAESTGDRDLEYEVAFAYSRVGDTLGYPLFPNLNQPFEAAIAYNKAISLCQLNPDNKKSRHLLAYLYAHYAALSPRLGKSELLEPYYQKALQLIHDATPNTIFEVRDGYAHHLLIQNRLDEAAAILAPALAQDAPPHTAMNLRAHAFEIALRRVDLNKALDAVESALAISRTAGREAVGLERTAAQLLEDRARIEFSRAHPSFFRPCRSVPFAREAAGIALKLARLDSTNATATIQTVQFLQTWIIAQGECPPYSEEQPYRELLESLHKLGLSGETADAAHAPSLLNQGKPRQAIALLLPYLNQSTKHPDTLYMAARGYLAVNEPLKAIPLLENALKLVMAEGVSHLDSFAFREMSLPIALHLGDALNLANRQSEARRVWQQAMDRVPTVFGKFPIAPSTRHWRSELQSRISKN